MVARSVLTNPTKSKILGAPSFFQRRPQKGASLFSPIFLLIFLPLSMAKPEEGKEVDVTAGLRDGALPCVPRSIGFLNSCIWNLFPAATSWVAFQRSLVVLPSNRVLRLELVLS
ncbi:hypothetical protein Pyn_13025 [Prunus yedoensis var. nudiflora]|uniref:Uncharacterized protein n=1 Tax=Prunus yedoensis var. nudiflora TaxID=2094558 RepID=A0A314UG51_PRUYE|nr:hypothetical protein Pyn_13025 [Prunus yedoensis var. nudiflora]